MPPACLPEAARTPPYSALPELPAGGPNPAPLVALSVPQWLSCPRLFLNVELARLSISARGVWVAPPRRKAQLNQLSALLLGAEEPTVLPPCPPAALLPAEGRCERGLPKDGEAPREGEWLVRERRRVLGKRAGRAHGHGHDAGMTCGDPRHSRPVRSPGGPYPISRVDNAWTQAYHVSLASAVPQSPCKLQACLCGHPASTFHPPWPLSSTPT